MAPGLEIIARGAAVGTVVLRSASTLFFVA